MRVVVPLALRDQGGRLGVDHLGRGHQRQVAVGRDTDLAAEGGRVGAVAVVGTAVVDVGGGPRCGRLEQLALGNLTDVVERGARQAVGAGQGAVRAGDDRLGRHRAERGDRRDAGLAGRDLGRAEELVGRAGHADGVADGRVGGEAARPAVDEDRVRGVGGVVARRLEVEAVEAAGRVRRGDDALGDDALAARGLAAPVPWISAMVLSPASGGSTGGTTTVVLTASGVPPSVAVKSTLLVSVSTLAAVRMRDVVVTLLPAAASPPGRARAPRPHLVDDRGRCGRRRPSSATVASTVVVVARRLTGVEAAGRRRLVGTRGPQLRSAPGCGPGSRR